MDISPLPRLAESIVKRTSTAASPDGFVPLYRLAKEFMAEVQFRPLLVEGMIATPKPNAAGEVSRVWKVLLDSETYPVSEKMYLDESSSRPLTARLRFTVAHELAHSLSFRPNEFGFQLAKDYEGIEDKRALVDLLEREANKLAPLMLVSEAALKNECAKNPEGFTMAQICAARKAWAVSREVFVRRLALLSLTDAAGLGLANCLRNIGIGMGEWRRAGVSVLSSWPLFYNFDRNIFPDFLNDLKNNRPLNLEKLFPNKSFSLSGGGLLEIETELSAGTERNPGDKNMRVLLSVEDVPQIDGKRFLFLVKAL